MMRIHHLNCGTLCPRGARWIHGKEGWFSQTRMVCHCLLIEGADGLILVDTGLGTADLERPKERLGRMFLSVSGAQLEPRETALRQVEALGFSARDVRHILLTHLDLDHAGGLGDFPHAEVHLMEEEFQAARMPRTLIERHRYRKVQWAHGPNWNRYRPEGEPWFGFSAVRQLKGLPPEILFIPLRGHTRGHAAIAVEHDSGWLVHAGDAYFYVGEVLPGGRQCPPALDLFQRVLQVDGAARLDNQRRLRELMRDHHGQIQLFCSHDPLEYERFEVARPKFSL